MTELNGHEAADGNQQEPKTEISEVVTDEKTVHKVEHKQQPTKRSEDKPERVSFSHSENTQQPTANLDQKIAEDKLENARLTAREKLARMSSRETALLGFLGGLILMGIIWAVASHFNDGRGNMGRFNRQPFNQTGMVRMNNSNGYYGNNMGGQINNMPNNVRGTQRNNMVNRNSSVPTYLTQSASPSTAGSQTTVSNASGSMSFYLNGNQLNLPYQIQNNQLTMQIKSLRDFMNSNSSDSVNFNVTDADGKSVASFSRAADLTSDQLTYNIENGQHYLINLKIADNNGNQLVNASQIL